MEKIPKSFFSKKYKKIMVLKILSKVSFVTIKNFYQEKKFRQSGLFR